MSHWPPHGGDWVGPPPDLDDVSLATDADAPPWTGYDDPPEALGRDSPWAPALLPRPRAPLPTFEPAVIERQLREAFGLPVFREGQREIVEAVLAGESALAVMPTGSGKSLCYQLPATLLPGVTVVVSPLIALMKDQVDSLVSLGLPATFINSTLSGPERAQRAERIVAGETKLVFVAPERFRSALFIRMLAQVEVSLLAVDEAHCISEWGHDFRPDYRELGRVREALGSPPTLALTATATPQVREDIKVQLGIAESDTYISGFERKNLFLEVYKASGKQDKIARIEALLAHIGGTALVYCATRKGVVEVRDILAEKGFSVGMYHGGMDDGARAVAQNAFMSSELRVLVATNAFGMGVDKANIRTIVHYQMPSTLEAYYQEAGRAGRDGQPSHCLFLYNYADRRVPDFFIDCSHPTRELVEQTWELASQGGLGQFDFDARNWADMLPGRVPDSAVSAALVVLAKAGHVELLGSPRGGRLEVRDGPETELRVEWAKLRQRREFEEDKLNQVVFFATAKRCRTQSLLRYFGSKISFAGWCGHCDLCVEVAPYASAAARRRKPAQKASPPKGSPTQPRTRLPEHPLDVCRKITAAIARCKQAESKHVVARVLAGSPLAELKTRGYDKLSTFGILPTLRTGEIEGLIDVLILHKLATEQSGLVGLSAAGVAVMKGDKGISEALQRTLGGAPPGARPQKLGEKRNPAVTDTVDETLAHARKGLSVQDIAKLRGFSTKTIVRHIVAAADAGVATGVDLQRYVEPTLLPAIRAAAETDDWRAGATGFRDAVNRQLKRDATFRQISLNIAYLLQQGELGPTGAA